MALATKITQLDLFINEQKELENKMQIERDESTKSQIRLLLHVTTSLQKRQAKQEEIIQSLVDFILDEKAP